MAVWRHGWELPKGLRCAARWWPSLPRLGPVLTIEAAAINLTKIDKKALYRLFNPDKASYQAGVRGVAQSGSAPGLGPGCREFESLHPDQLF